MALGRVVCQCFARIPLYGVKLWARCHAVAKEAARYKRRGKLSVYNVLFVKANCPYSAANGNVKFGQLELQCFSLRHMRRSKPDLWLARKGYNFSSSWRTVQKISLDGRTYSIFFLLPLLVGEQHDWRTLTEDGWRLQTTLRHSRIGTSFVWEIVEYNFFMTKQRATKNLDNGPIKTHGIAEMGHWLSSKAWQWADLETKSSMSPDSKQAHIFRWIVLGLSRNEKLIS